MVVLVVMVVFTHKMHKTLTKKLKEIENLTQDQLEIRYKNLLVAFQMLSNKNNKLNKYIQELESQIIKQNET